MCIRDRHVLEAWRTNINSKIKTKETRDKVFKILQTLLYKLDENAFKKMLHEVMKKLSNDKETYSFCEYFEKSTDSGLIVFEHALG